MIVAGTEPAPPAATDLVIFPTSGDRQPQPLVTSPARETGAAMSPDDQWIAFGSNESGIQDIYLMKVDGSGKRPVSTSGGTSPLWRADGLELFYLAANGDVMSIAVTDIATMATEEPKRLFHACGESAVVRQALIGNDPMIASVKTGERFLMACRPADTFPTAISVTLDPILPSK